MKALFRFISKLTLPFVFFLIIAIGVLIWMGSVARDQAEQEMHKSNVPTTLQTWYDRRTDTVNFVEDGGIALRQAIETWSMAETDSDKSRLLTKIRKALTEPTVTFQYQPSDRSREVENLKQIDHVAKAMLESSERYLSRGQLDHAIVEATLVLKLTTAMRAIPRMEVVQHSEQIRQDAVRQIEKIMAAGQPSTAAMDHLYDQVSDLLLMYERDSIANWAALPMTQMFVLLEKPGSIDELAEQQVAVGLYVPGAAAFQSREMIDVFSDLHDQMKTSRNAASAMIFFSNRRDLTPGYDRPIALFHRLALGGGLTPEQMVPYWLGIMRYASDAEAMLQLTAAAILLDRHYKRRGRWADTWSLVTPVSPLDPYTAEVIPLERTDRGIVLRSAGWDGKYGTRDDITYTLER